MRVTGEGREAKGAACGWREGEGDAARLVDGGRREQRESPAEGGRGESDGAAHAGGRARERDAGEGKKTIPANTEGSGSALRVRG